ncbi:MAG: hypothetical protein ABW032_06375 [Burkholderiaceae bacterium]
MLDFNTSLDPNGPSADQLASGPSSGNRAGTWSAGQPSNELALVPGVERRVTLPAMRTVGATLGSDARSAAELLNLVPILPHRRLNALGNAAALLVQSMLSQFTSTGSTVFPALREPVSLTSQHAARTAWFAQRLPEPELTVNLWSTFITDDPEPSNGLRPVTAITIAPPDGGAALSGHFEWIGKPPDAHAYAGKIGISPYADAHASARMGIYLVGTTLARLKFGSGEEMAPLNGQARRLRIDLPIVMGGADHLTAQIGARPDGGFELRVADAAHRCELLAQFPAEDLTPAANQAATLLKQVPEAAREHLKTLTALISIATKVMETQRRSDPDSTEFPLMDQRLDLASPERGAAHRAAGLEPEPEPEWTIRLSAGMEIDFAGLNQPTIGMTVDAHQGDRLLGGHLKWIGQPPGDQYARWIGHLPDADAQASARKAIFLLGSVLPNLGEGSGQAMPPQPDEAGRIKLEPPPGGATRITFELGYRTDGGLRLRAHDLNTGGVLSAEFSPGARQLLKPAPRAFESLALVSKAAAPMFSSLENRPIDLSPGMPGETRLLTTPAFAADAKRRWLHQFKARNQAFAEFSDQDLEGVVRKSPPLLSGLQNALNEVGHEFEFRLEPKTLSLGLVQDDLNTFIQNERTVAGITILSKTDGQSVQGHFEGLEPNFIDDDAVRQALHRISSAFNNLPLATGHELEPWPGDQKRLMLTLPGEDPGQESRFQALLAIGDHGATVDAQVWDADKTGVLFLRFRNDSDASALANP